jgi:serine protease inhibitor
VLNLAARIFATDKFPLTQEFLDDTKNVFDAEAESLNFNDGEAAASRINQWVS